MTYTVIQRGGGSGGSTSISFTATTQGSCLIINVVSDTNAAGCTAGGHTLLPGAYGTGHNNNYAGIFYLPPSKNPGGITSATVTGCYAVGYIEVSGITEYPAIVAGYTSGGTATPGTSFAAANPGASASNFTVFVYAYDVSNGGTYFSDGSGSAAIISNYGQYSYTLTASGFGGTMPSGTYDCVSVSFAPASSPGVTPSVPPPAGVFRGSCGNRIQNVGETGSVTPQVGILAYEQWLGRPVRYVLDFMTHVPTTWAQFENGFLDQGDTNCPYVNDWGTLLPRWTMVLGVPVCAGKSIGSGGTTWAAEAAGTNDSHWTTLGNNLISWGYGNAIIRLGREFNGNWYNWSPAVSGDTIAQYQAGWQHIVTLLRGLTGSNLKFMWNPTIGMVSGETGSSQETTNWYPGNAYVDSIGIDIYDWGNPSGTYPTQTSAYTTPSAAEQQTSFYNDQNEDDGLLGMARFAQSCGKPFAMPEWGLQLWTSGTTYAGGGDNPYFINQMANVAAYTFMQALWEDTGMGVYDTDADARRTSGLAVPNSRAAYLAAFSIVSDTESGALTDASTINEGVSDTDSGAGSETGALLSLTGYPSAATTGPAAGGYSSPTPVTLSTSTTLAATGYPSWCVPGSGAQSGSLVVSNVTFTMAAALNITSTTPVIFQGCTFNSTMTAASSTPIMITLNTTAAITFNYCTLAGSSTQRVNQCIQQVSNCALTVSNCNFYNMRQAVQLGSGMTAAASITGNYMHGIVLYTGDHSEPIYAGANAGSSNITISGNTILNNQNQTAVVYFNNIYAFTNVTVSNNLLAGGDFAIYCGNASSTSFVVTNNVFSTAYFPLCGTYGTVFNTAALPIWGTSSNVFSGNTWWDGPNAGNTIAPPIITTYIHGTGVNTESGAFTDTAEIIVSDTESGAFTDVVNPIIVEAGDTGTGTDVVEFLSPGYPNATNTGPAAGGYSSPTAVALSANQNINLTGNPAWATTVGSAVTISNVNFTITNNATITIKNTVSTVTFQGCTFNGSAGTASSSQPTMIVLDNTVATTIKYCKFYADGTSATRIMLCIQQAVDTALTVEYCDFADAKQVIQLVSNTVSGVVIENNYMHNSVFYTGDHTELIYAGASGGGSNISITGNTILNPLNQTATIYLHNTYAFTNCTITGNLLAGGDYGLYLGSNASTGMLVENNVVSTIYFGPGGGGGGLGGGYYGPVYTSGPPVFGAYGNVWSNNTWLDGPNAGVAIASPGPTLVTDSDTGTGADTWINLTATTPVTDTGAGTDNAPLPNVGVQATESGTGTDTASVTSATITASDTGTGTDTTSSSQVVADSDSGTGTDNVAIIQAHVSDTESGAGTDTAVVGIAPVVIHDSDTGAFADSARTTATIYSADSGAFTDTSSAPPNSYGPMLTGSIPHVFVPPLPQVSVTCSTAWNVAVSSLTTTGSTTWVTAGQVIKTGTSTWNATSHVTTGVTSSGWVTAACVSAKGHASWTTIGRINATKLSEWNTLQAVTKTDTATWKTLSPVTKTATSTWATVGRCSSGVHKASYNIRAHVCADADTTWNVRFGIPVTKTGSGAWNVSARVAATRSSTWNVAALAVVTKTGSSTWNVDVRKSASGTSGWRNTCRRTRTQHTCWYTLERIFCTPDSATWRARVRVSASGSSGWNALGRGEKSGTSTWVVSRRCSQAGTARWKTIGRTSKTGTSDWRTLQRVFETDWTAQASLTKWNLRARTSASDSSAWETTRRSTRTSGSKWRVLFTVTPTKLSHWNTLSGVTTTDSSAWATWEQVTSTGNSAWVTIGHKHKHERSEWNTLCRVS